LLIFIIGVGDLGWEFVAGKVLATSLIVSFPPVPFFTLNQERHQSACALKLHYATIEAGGIICKLPLEH